MKLYHWQISPNARRVRIYVAEAGLNLPMEEVSTGGNDLKLKASYIEKYPHALVPMLELDDGTQIGETMAIVRYLEELQPSKSKLFGIDAKERALVDMWDRRAYEEGMLATGEVFRNTHPSFVDRGVQGTLEPVKQIPDLAKRGLERVRRFFNKFNAQLAHNDFVAGPRYTVADATLLAVVDFAAMVNLKIPADCKHLQRWYDAVSKRPSAKA